jgi:hypothetical protein
MKIMKQELQVVTRDEAVLSSISIGKGNWNL